MVMISRNARKNVCENSNNSSGDKMRKAPPWCSSARRFVGGFRRNTPSICNLRTHFLEKNSLNDPRNKGQDTHHSKWTNVKNCRRENTNGRKKRKTIILLVVFFVALATMNYGMEPFMRFTREFGSPFAGYFSHMREDVSNDVSEECCNKMKQLAAELMQTKMILRRARLKRSIKLSRRGIKLRADKVDEENLIQDAIATIGDNTVEWRGGRVALWGVVPLWPASPPPQTILDDTPPIPGNCWPFRGSHGEVVIELPKRQHVRRLSFEHIRPDTARSAPKDFAVFGILENGTRIKSLAGKYKTEKEAKQYFLISKTPALKHLALQVYSNHGNSRYTCIYRVKLYGK